MTILVNENVATRSKKVESVDSKACSYRATMIQAVLLRRPMLIFPRYARLAVQLRIYCRVT